jgi:hypothetical protein
VDLLRKEAIMKLSFLATGATCRTRVDAHVEDGRIIMATGRELTAFEWRVLRYQVQEATDDEQTAVTEWIRSWRLR